MTPREKVCAALAYIPAHDRNTWVKIGMAVKSELGDEGFDLWNEWSQRDDSYNESDARAAFRSFTANGKVTVGTLFHEAKRHGFVPNGSEPPAPSAEAIAKRKRQNQVVEKRKAKARHRAADTASKVWKAAPPAQADHHYLMRKGIPPVVTLRELPATELAQMLGYAPKEGDVLLAGRVLIAPVMVNGEFSSLEFIDEVGRKSALAGGAKAGGRWGAQRRPEGDGDGLTLLLAEGVATAISGKVATDHQAFAALSSGNLLRAAQGLRGNYPQGKFIVLADIGNGEREAHKAAHAVGGLVAIPEFTTEEVEAFRAEHGKVPNDFNDLHQIRGAEAVAAAIANAKATDGVGGQPASPLATADPTSAPSGTVAQVLIGIGARCDLFHDDRGDGYAVTTDRGIRRTLRLRGRDFRRWICGRYYAETSKAANGEAIAAALGVLEAKATFDAPQITLFNRFAEQNGVVFIDLCDERWRIVKITAHGWKVLDKPPILFRRYAHQQALPEPQRGGDLASLWPFLNVRNQDERHLVVAWVVIVPFSTAPRPALTPHGPQGAAKSTLARALKSLLDPSATDTIDLGRDPSGLAQVLDHNALPCFDNLTSIPTWASDMLCKAVTGGAFSKRELYTDAEDVFLTFKRALIVTGINIPTHAPDLLDRMLLVELERIAPENRRDEREFWNEFNATRPRLFGAILDAISGVLRYRDKVSLARLPRMADFARLACAYAEHSGIGAAKMMQIIMDNAGRQTQEVIASDPLATAVRDFVDNRKWWEGTATELLTALNEPYFRAKTAPVPEGWPKSAKSLGRRLKVLQSTFADAGVAIVWKSSPDGKSRLIGLAEKSAAQTSETSGRSEANAGAALAPDVSSRPISANVGETSERKPNAGAPSGMTDVSDNTLPVTTASAFSAADVDEEVI